MFEEVGKDTTPKDGRRGRAFVLTLLLNGSVIAGFLWAGSRVAEAVVADAPIEVALELSAPPPPPPPPPPPGGKKSSKPKTEEEKKPEETPKEEIPQEVEKLPEQIPETKVETNEPEGVEGGVEGGVAGGVLGGTVGGVIGGQLGGELGSTGPVKQVHWSEVKIKTRASVRADDYPAAAAALNLPEQRCVVRININEKGLPESVVPRTCPELFHQAAINVAMRYRFYPLKENGQAVKAAFDLALNFKPAS